MAFLSRGNAAVYYEETGQGDPVIAIHGLIENTTYWRLPGITARLAQKYRVIAMDMRGHGKTKVVGEPYGYDAETVAADIEALADHLGIERFHLLTHSTGGFAASRWAMKSSHRLSSLMLTDTSSATCPMQGTREQRDAFFEKFAASFEKGTWKDTIEFVRENPFPFFRGIAETDNNEAMWDMAYEIISTGDRNSIAAFVRSFYQDPDLMEEGLKKITCPVLILLGEKDDLFIEPARIMAENIPSCRHVVLKGVGHMTAIEAPDRLSDELMRFMAENPL
ncbi:MAG: alpha/beta hydrolase [Thermodesulfobacteriota bacterium]|nr:alpha/beta hydrolase [Thermodesulfobacteriota bacterium]